MSSKIPGGAFDDIVELATGRPLLTAGAVPASVASKVVRVSWRPGDGMDAGLNGIPVDQIPEGEMSYRDFRENVLADAYEPLRYSRPEVRTAIDECLLDDMVYESVASRLEPRLKEATDWIVSDLYDAALARGGLGRTTFFERIIEVYLAGGWPVGFADAWGVGRILAVFPGNRRDAGGPPGE